MRNVTGIGKNYFFKIFEVEILAPRGVERVVIYEERGKTPSQQGPLGTVRENENLAARQSSPIRFSVQQCLVHTLTRRTTRTNQVDAYLASLLYPVQRLNKQEAELAALWADYP